MGTVTNNMTLIYGINSKIEIFGLEIRNSSEFSFLTVENSQIVMSDCVFEDISLVNQTSFISIKRSSEAILIKNLKIYSVLLNIFIMINSNSKMVQIFDIYLKKSHISNILNILLNIQ